MNSPYLIIDRSGNAVDISTEPPTCHDHYRTCHGARTVWQNPGAIRRARGTRRGRPRLSAGTLSKGLIGSAYIPDEEFSKRLRNIRPQRTGKTGGNHNGKTRNTCE